MTHQADKKEEDEKGPAEHSFTKDITVSDSGHCDDEKVNTCPVRELMWIVELQWIARVLQL
jgi:hypothetical protein